ncbi:ATP-binding protein [Pelagibius marinus]|uniref:ATP-binding protein n=1 Tax=Pelagibius marinus TaxID=2762760 RepID=UPI0018726717|nr:ATP-binding protein [Pelagibius marinus]
MLTNYGLTQDPFAIVPDGPVDNWAGREELKEDLMDLVMGVRASDIGSTEFLVLHGELGAGKSHALRYLKTQIEKPGSTFNSLAIYVERPRVSAKLNFLELHKFIIAEIGRDRIKVFCANVKEEIDITISELAAAAGFGDEPNKSSFEPRAIEGIKKNNRNMAQLLRRGASQPDKVFDFLSGAIKCDGSEYEGKIDSDFMAAKVLGDLLRVLTSELRPERRIFESVYIFIDECEILFDAKATESDPVFSGFRELINGLPYGLGLILSFSAATALIEAYMPQHLLKRMTHDFIEVPMLEDGQAIQFLKEQLNTFRPVDCPYQGTFYPFSEAAISHIVENQTTLTPRNLFKDCRRVLERAIRRHKLEPGEEITQDLAERILEHRR